jgi:hypothetical protein
MKLGNTGTKEIRNGVNMLRKKMKRKKGENYGRK